MVQAKQGRRPLWLVRGDREEERKDDSETFLILLFSFLYSIVKFFVFQFLVWNFFGAYAGPGF